MEGNTIGTILTILILVGKWKTFEKLGEKGWKGIIPVYSDYVIFRMAGMSGLNILWSVASVIIAAITVALGIGAGINESTALMGWTIVMLLVGGHCSTCRNSTDDTLLWTHLQEARTQRAVRTAFPLRPVRNVDGFRIQQRLARKDQEEKTPSAETSAKRGRSGRWLCAQQPGLRGQIRVRTGRGQSRLFLSRFPERKKEWNAKKAGCKNYASCSFSF